MQIANVKLSHCEAKFCRVWAKFGRVRRDALRIWACTPQKPNLLMKCVSSISYQLSVVSQEFLMRRRRFFKRLPITENRYPFHCKKIVPPMIPKTVNGIAIIKRILQLKPLPIGSSSVLQPGHASRYVGTISMTTIKSVTPKKNLYILTLLSRCLREIHQNVENRPERDNKNPVDGTRIDADVTVCRETPCHCHTQNNKQPYNSTQHVNGMAPN